jgi:hypothetical protein
MAANRSRRVRLVGRFESVLMLWRYYMKEPSDNAANEEPMGIVISGGSRPEPRPLFLAYEWGPAPEEPAARQDVKAA